MLCCVVCLRCLHVDGVCCVLEVCHSVGDILCFFSCVCVRLDCLMFDLCPAGWLMVVVSCLFLLLFVCCSLICVVFVVSS